jgi:hypothetical protein
MNDTAAIQTHSDVDVPADETIEFASAHAVLLSEDLFCQQLWRWLDADAKAALRVVSKGMRSLVDGAVQVVASPSSGASANDLRSALLRWPAVRDLTLLNVIDTTDLSPLSTATIAGLTSLTVREVGGEGAMRMGAHHACTRADPSLKPALGWAWVHRAWLEVPRSRLALGSLGAYMMRSIRMADHI